MNSVSIFAGTRPEIIKMAPLVLELKKRSQARGRFQVRFCFTGQHVDLAQPFLDFFGLKPDSRLQFMSPGQSLGQLTSRACEQLDQYFDGEKNTAATLVQGDTTTAFASALTSFYHRIPVGHVEAGLRTKNVYEPFPEELNRRLVSKIADWHYAPTKAAQATLIGEGVDPARVFVTGNTGVDAVLWAKAKVVSPQNVELQKYAQSKLVLITIHRRENLGSNLEKIGSAISELVREFADHVFILPVHPNPVVKSFLNETLARLPNLRLLEPLSYGDLIWVMKQAKLILSDSGGLQEEAPSFGVPVLVLRDETERPEAVTFGTSVLVGSEKNAILREARLFLTGEKKVTDKTLNPFGDGSAAVRIADHLEKTCLL